MGTVPSRKGFNLYMQMSVDFYDVPKREPEYILYTSSLTQTDDLPENYDTKQCVGDVFLRYLPNKRFHEKLNDTMLLWSSSLSMILGTESPLGLTTAPKASNSVNNFKRPVCSKV